MLKKRILEKKAFRFRRFERKKYSAYNSMHKVVTIGVLSIATLTYSVGKTANAQTTKGDTITMFGTLEEVSIEDELSEPLNQLGKVSVVITREEIECLKPQSVSELLSLTAGIDVQTRGVHSVQSDITLRGGNFDQTAVLLNGVNLTNPHTGHYSLDLPINISDIERIEIIKGPTAIVYGASAFSGGVNIITKKDTSNLLTAKAEGGEYGFFSGEASTSFKIDKMENYLSFGVKNSDGYISNSDYDIYNIMYEGRLRLRKGNKIDFGLGYNKKDYGANTFYSASYPNQYEKTRGFTSSIRGLWNISDRLSFFPTAYYSMHTDEFYLIRNVSTPNRHKSNVLGSNLGFVYRYKTFSLNFGGDVRYEEIFSTVLGKESKLYEGVYNHYDNRTNVSFFLSGDYKYKRWDFVLGLMSYLGSAIKTSDISVYPSVNVNYSISLGWEMFFSFSTSSRLPTFTELYYKDAVHESNPSLRREKARSWDIGIKNLNHIAITSFSVYYMQARDMIDWVKYSSEDEKWRTANLNNLDKCGFDLESKIYLRELFGVFRKNTILHLSYSYMYQRQTDIDYISQYALNYLRHKLTTKLFLPLTERFTLSFDSRYCVRKGSYIEYTNGNKGAKKSFKPYMVLDCGLNYSLRVGKKSPKVLDIYLNCSNITNREYFDIGNIPQPKRWIIGGVRLRLSR